MRANVCLSVKGRPYPNELGSCLAHVIRHHRAS
jgi:hypothetical protein